MSFRRRLHSFKRRRAAVVGSAVAAVLALAGLTLLIVHSASHERHGGTLRRPIDPRQQTALAFGQRSHWLQPWRAYLDTVPATRLSDAIGINFNVEPAEAEATARLLSESGFTRARVSFGWESIAYSNPDRLRQPGRIRAVLQALKRHHIRPLLLLNADHGAPGPTRFFSAKLRAPAVHGARRVKLDPATAKRVIPGRTGLNDPSGKAADVLFTAVASDGTCTLSKPLPRDLPAGPARAATLRYPPFGPPRLPDGRPNPVFERTLRGWLKYALVMAREARAVVGSEAFDVEVWNELSFGSDFLYQERYYDPPRERGQGDTIRAILKRTVLTLRSRYPRIGIGDGFASQTPFSAGATSPRGLTAIDKHPYHGMTRFPKDATESSIEPLDARGRPDFQKRRARGARAIRRDRWIPHYDAFFPEYFLTAIQTEHLVRDLSPFTTDVYGVAHGRKTHPPGGNAPGMWITEANLDPTGADPSDPANPGGGPISRLTPRDVRHLHAKAALRYYTAFVNKGASAVDLYAVKGQNLELVDPAFFARLGRAGNIYPGRGAGGETMDAVRRLAHRLAAAAPISHVRPLSLLAISDDDGHKQFEGDGTYAYAHPPLYDRDVVAFLPYQLDASSYVVPAYVMTRNLAKLYDKDAPDSDPSRYDMPPSKFRLAIGGVDAAHAHASATDPLTGAGVETKIVSRGRRRIVVEMELTDSPRLLRLSD